LLAIGLAVAGAIALFAFDAIRRPVALPAPAVAGELVLSVNPGFAAQFFGPVGEPSGFDVDMARLLARTLKLPLRVVVADSAAQVFEQVASGHAHIGAGSLLRPRAPVAQPPAAAPLVPKPDDRVLWTRGQWSVQPMLICSRDGYKPAGWRDLAGETVAYLDDPGADPGNAALRAAHPEIRWEASSAPSFEALIARVSDGRVGYALATSHVVDAARDIFLGFETAFAAGERRELAWIVPTALPELAATIDAFVDRAVRDGTVARLAARYFPREPTMPRLDVGAFHERLRTLLPDYRLLFQHAQAATGIEWRLLAAVAYQESQWDPFATSETGVRGVMQLTDDTARRLGVGDRLDAKQSVDGAARYIAELKRNLPARIQEPDRTWLALAAFNIGSGHLEDARILAQKKKLDPDQWRDVRQVLPLLALPEYHGDSKNGYARGGMPVAFVDRVRAYYDILLAREAAYIPRLHVREASNPAPSIFAIGAP
jgi:membrane-bound lytic murein transglycosylase F